MGQSNMWIFPNKADTVKRKVSPSAFHPQKDKDTVALNAFFAGYRRLRFTQRWSVRCPDDFHSVHDRASLFS
jgi:hypothetical protein